MTGDADKARADADKARADADKARANDGQGPWVRGLDPPWADCAKLIDPSAHFLPFAPAAGIE
jgi:hypothetical protein